MLFFADPSGPGGVQEHAYYLSKSIEKLGHKVTVLGPSFKTALPYPRYTQIVDYVNVPLPKGNDIYYLKKKESLKEYSEILNKKNFDLLHIHEPFIPFASWDIMTKVDIPIVVTFHAAWDAHSNLNIFNDIIPLFKNTFSEKVNGAIFVSNTSKRRWAKICADGMPRQVIYNGIDHKKFFYKKKTTDKTVNLLFLARIVPRKGLMYLLKAIKILKTIEKKPFKLFIVGDGPEKRHMEEYVDRNDIHRFVQFEGFVPDEKKRLYYQKADVFCVPHVNEGFGITLLEAMSCGVPITGFKNLAFNEVLKNYPNPEFLVKPKNITQLAKALKKLINNSKIRKDITNWSLKESKKYDWSNVAESTEQFYYKVLNK